MKLTNGSVTILTINSKALYHAFPANQFFQLGEADGGMGVGAEDVVVNIP